MRSMLKPTCWIWWRNSKIAHSQNVWYSSNYSQPHCTSCNYYSPYVLINNYPPISLSIRNILFYSSKRSQLSLSVSSVATRSSVSYWGSCAPAICWRFFATFERNPLMTEVALAKRCFCRSLSLIWHDGISDLRSWCIGAFSLVYRLLSLPWGLSCVCIADEPHNLKTNEGSE